MEEDRVSNVLVSLLLAAWLFPGLFGHGPWKPDEAYTFGLVYHILESGDWLVPTLAGQPFVDLQKVPDGVEIAHLCEKNRAADRVKPASRCFFYERRARADGQRPRSGQNASRMS